MQLMLDTSQDNLQEHCCVWIVLVSKCSHDTILTANGCLCIAHRLRFQLLMCVDRLLNQTLSNMNDSLSEF